MIPLVLGASKSTLSFVKEICEVCHLLFLFTSSPPVHHLCTSDVKQLIVLDLTLLLQVNEV